jgi:hypothetical protein
MASVQRGPSAVQPNHDDEPFLCPVTDEDRRWWADFTLPGWPPYEPTDRDLEEMALAWEETDEAFPGAPEPPGTPAEVLAAEASYYEGRDTAAGRFLAAELRTLAALALRLEASTWEALAEGRERAGWDREKEVWDDGYHEGERRAR